VCGFETRSVGREVVYYKNMTGFGIIILLIMNSEGSWCVVSVAVPMGNVSWMLFPGRTELGTQVKTGSQAGRSHTQ